MRVQFPTGEFRLFSEQIQVSVVENMWTWVATLPCSTSACSHHPIHDYQNENRCVPGERCVDPLSPQTRHEDWEGLECFKV